MKKAHFLFLPVFLFAGFASCSDDDEKQEEKGIAVETIEASACVDLSDRTGWLLKLGIQNDSPIEYNYTASGKTLKATSARNESYYFPDWLKEGDKLNSSNRMDVRLVAPGYYRKTKDTGPHPPVIEDQSTPEKLLNADMLAFEYKDVIAKDVKGVELVHANALLEFEAIGFPAEARIQLFLNGNMPVTPLQENENKSKYKVIILPDYKFAIGTRIGQEYVVCHIVEDNDYRVRADGHYTFKLRYDEATKKVTVEDMVRTVWSEE